MIAVRIFWRSTHLLTGAINGLSQVGSKSIQSYFFSLIASAKFGSFKREAFAGMADAPAGATKLRTIASERGVASNQISALFRSKEKDE